MANRNREAAFSRLIGARDLHDMTGNSTELKTSINNLKHFRGDLDRSFNLIAETLPKLSGDISALSDTLSYLSSGRGKKDIEVQLEEVQSLTDDIQRFLDDRQHHSAHTINLMLAISSSIEQLNENLAKMIKIAFRIDLVSLNAEVVAERVGAAGRAFSVITGNLRQASREVNAISRAVIAKSDRNAAQVGKLRDSLAEMNQRLADQSEHCQGEIEGLNSHLVGSLEKITSDSADYVGQLGALLSQVQQIMMALQQQDIIRQCVDHIGLVLAEIKKNQGYENRIDDSPDSIDAALEAMVFQDCAGELGARLYRENRNQLLEFLDSTEEHLQSLSELANSFETSSLQGEDSLSLEKNITAQLGNVEELVSGTQSAHKLLTQSFAELNDTAAYADQLGSKLVDLRDIARHMYMAQVMMKIETGSYGTDEMKDAAPISEAMRQVTEEMSRFLKQAEQGCTEIKKGLTASNADREETTTLALTAEFETRISSLEQRLVETSASFATCLSRCREQVHQIQGATDDFLGTLAELRISFTAHDEIETVCMSLSDRAKQHRQSIEKRCGRRSEELPTSQKLATLVNRFTVLSNKKIAEDLVGTSIEDGDASGELTLF